MGSASDIEPLGSPTLRFLNYLAYRLYCQQEDVHPSDWIEFSTTFRSTIDWQ